jgi:hypothetical protein
MLLTALVTVSSSRVDNWNGKIIVVPCFSAIPCNASVAPRNLWIVSFASQNRKYSDK